MFGVFKIMKIRMKKSMRVSSVDATVLCSPSSTLSQFLHNVTEYAYTNKCAKQEEDHKNYHPSPDATQVRSSSNTGDHRSPSLIGDTVGICHESSSSGLNISKSREVDTKHNPEDEAER